MTSMRPTTRSVAMPCNGPEPVEMAAEDAAARLADYIRRHPRLLVLTGAGVSTDSGIPDYRDVRGAWKRRQPVQHHAFLQTTRFASATGAEACWGGLLSARRHRTGPISTWPNWRRWATTTCWSPRMLTVFTRRPVAGR